MAKENAHLFTKYRVTDVSTVKDFLARYYRPERYTGRGEEYAATLLASHEDNFVRDGFDIISYHDSVTGDCVAIFREGTGGPQPPEPTFELRCPSPRLRRES